MIGNTCNNCIHCDKTGYKDLPAYAHLAFCNRFKEVTKLSDKECVGFLPTAEAEKHFRNLAKAQQLKINLQQQLNFDL